MIRKRSHNFLAVISDLLLTLDSYPSSPHVFSSCVPAHQIPLLYRHNRTTVPHLSKNNFVDFFALPPVACTKNTLHPAPVHGHGVLPVAKEDALFLQPFLVLSWPGRITLLHLHAPLLYPGLLENAVCTGIWQPCLRARIPRPVSV
jgi:hypothetical protein